MATTWIKPLHVNKGKTIAQTITDRTNYAENPDKTREFELVTGHECSPRFADKEFLLAKQEYGRITGRTSVRFGKDVLAYHIRQSFKPGEITAEQANEVGRALALRFTKGNHAFIVATHIDRRHIHNHIIFNSTTLDCTRKYDDFLHSNRAVRRLSDQICIENGLSIVENPKPSKGNNYHKWLGDKEPSWREQLEAAIDTVLAQKPADFEAFIELLMEAEVEVKRRGKTISLRMKTQDSQGKKQKGFIRFSSLSANYTVEAIRERIEGKRTAPPKRSKSPIQPPKVNLLIDVQNSIKAQNSPGYAQWAKIFNLKTAASTLIFLQENGITELDVLQEKAQKAKDDFNAIAVQIQTADTRMNEITVLQKHIGAYSKTREVYAAYRKAGYSKKYLADHEPEIAAHKAAKKHFDALGLKKLPTIKTLQTEYASLAAEKKKLYHGYRQARDYMQKILTARQNTEQLLNYKDSSHETNSERTER